MFLGFLEHCKKPDANVQEGGFHCQLTLSNQRLPMGESIFNVAVNSKLLDTADVSL